MHWDKKGIFIHNKVMALYPNAYSYYRFKRVKILNTIPFSEEYATYLPKEALEYLEKIVKIKEPPGKIIKVINKIGIVVSTSDIPILITEIQLQGKRATSSVSMIQQLNPVSDQFFTNHSH